MVEAVVEVVPGVMHDKTGKAGEDIDLYPWVLLAVLSFLRMERGSGQRFCGKASHVKGIPQ